MEKIKILGIKIDNITFNHVLSSIENYLNSSKTRVIVTPSGNNFAGAKG